MAWQQSDASKATKTVTKTVVGTDGKETTQDVTKAANKVTTAAKDSKLDTKTDINTAEGKKSKQSSATPATQKTADKVSDETAAARSASKVALAGAMAVNDITKDVHATFTKVTIDNATAVKNIAQSDGAAVAAGLALGLTKAAQDSSVSFSGAGAASVNASNNTVEALLKDVTMTNSDGSNVYNLAYDSDTQVAGGVNAALAIGGKMGIGAGGTLAVNDIQNNLYATISGGSLGNSSAALGNVVNHAANEITQVTTALGVSAAGGAKSGVSFDGAMAYGKITNNAKPISRMGRSSRRRRWITRPTMPVISTRASTRPLRIMAWTLQVRPIRRTPRTMRQRSRRHRAVNRMMIGQKTRPAVHNRIILIRTARAARNSSPRHFPWRPMLPVTVWAAPGLRPSMYCMVTARLWWRRAVSLQQVG